MRIQRIKIYLCYALSTFVIFKLGYYCGGHYSVKISCKVKSRGTVIPRGKDIYQNITYKRNVNPSIASNQTTFTSEVTVIVYDADHGYIKNIIKLYPGIKVLLASSKNMKGTTPPKRTAAKKTMQEMTVNIKELGEFTNKALGLNSLMRQVKTPYFLHIDRAHCLEPAASQQSVGWLLHALQQVPLLDIIGGSVLSKNGHHDAHRKYDKLEVPCYRLHHYNWTYSESYEYSQSLGDIMVCQRTSTSFLARTTSLVNNITFDQEVGSMIFEDFFLRAKKLGLKVATKPEVFFIVPERDQSSSASQTLINRFTVDTIQFGLKHQVMRLRTATDEVLEICERFSTLGGKLFPKEDLLCDYDKAKPYWKIQHWAYGGMYAPPTMVIALQRSLKTVARFLDEHNYQWALQGGCTLGSLKMRGILPWDAGDVDIDTFKPKNELLNFLRTKFEPKFPTFLVEDYPGGEVIVKPRHGFGGWVTIMILPKPENGLKLIRMYLDGYYVPVRRNIFYEFRKAYGDNYLRHAMYNGKAVACVEDSNTCLPDFKNIFNGRGGTWKEFFVER